MQKTNVSFVWLDEDSGQINSWYVLNPSYDTRTPAGMVRLNKELGELKKTETIIIQYIRRLRVGTMPEQRGGIMYRYLEARFAVGFLYTNWVGKSVDKFDGVQVQ